MSLSSGFDQNAVAELQKVGSGNSTHYVLEAGETSASAGTSLAVALADIEAGDVVHLTPATVAGTPANGYVVSVAVNAGVGFTITTVGDSTSATWYYQVLRSHV